MSPRTITLHAFCSAKGGVGKSTLAIASAKILAAGKGERACVLVDADLTGTSLADGLNLCAPDVAQRPDQAPDFDAAPTGRFLDRVETVRLRDKRKHVEWMKQPPPPPFLNDLLIHGGDDERECRVDALLWKHSVDDKVLYLPSSPLRQDILVALGWLYREEPFAWLQRFTWLLDGMSKLIPTLRDVVIDLPPGLFGFAHEVLALLSNLKLGTPLPSGFPSSWTDSEITWEGNPILVTTPDRNDLVAAVEYFVRFRSELPHLGMLVNKFTTDTRDSVREMVRASSEEGFGAEEQLAFVDRMGSTLGAVFRNGDLRMTDDVRKLSGVLRLMVSP